MIKNERGNGKHSTPSRPHKLDGDGEGYMDLIVGNEWGMKKWRENYKNGKSNKYV